MNCENPKLLIRGNNGKLVELFIFDKVMYLTYYSRLATSPKSKLHKPDFIDKVIRLPCGYCRACKINLYQEWATRCWLEARQLKNNQFITLTYDNQHLPEKGVNKQDLSRFMRALREHFRRKHGITGIRFFACGEYGEETFRPHYHILLFNCPPFGDEKKYKENDLGQPLYKSKILEHIWGKGFCTIGAVTRQSCDYVCRYLVKSSYGKKPNYLNPEFRSMSKLKGIGINYLLDNLEQIIADDTIRLTGTKRVKLPRYFDKKIKEIIGKERFEAEIAIPRAKKAQAYFESEIVRTNLTGEQLIDRQIMSFQESLKRLERNFEIYEKENKDD